MNASHVRQMLLSAAAAVLIGCSNSGSNQTPTSTPTPTPTPTPVTVSSVSIAGSTSGTAGQTAALTATAAMSDGSTRAVTDQATWESTSTAVVTVNSAGLLTFVAAGEADVKATYQSVSATRHVTVSAVVKAKYRITGVVTESTTGKIVVQAVVRVQDGPDAGRTAETDSAGKYAMDGVTEGAFTLKATHAGYDDTTKSVTLSGDAQVDLTLTPNLDVTSYYGTFNVGLSVLNESCEFPPAPGNSGTVRLSGNRDGTGFSWVITERGTTRSYSGDMNPDGSFTARGSGVFAGFLPTHGPSVLEMMHDFSGSVSGTVSGRNISGVESVTFGDPCPGRTLRLAFSGSK